MVGIFDRSGEGRYSYKETILPCHGDMSTPLEVQEVDQIDYEELARTELEEQVVAFLDTLEGETVDNFADTFVRDFVRSFAFVKERESDKIGLK